MRFSVTWIPSAESRLTKLWLDSRVSAQITSAADRIDGALALNPLELGESRPADLRIAFDYPLAILFHVDRQAKKVAVIDVWLY